MRRTGEKQGSHDSTGTHGKDNAPCATRFPARARMPHVYAAIAVGNGTYNGLINMFKRRKHEKSEAKKAQDDVDDGPEFKHGPNSSTPFTPCFLAVPPANTASFCADSKQFWRRKMAACTVGAVLAPYSLLELCWSLRMIWIPC